MKSNLSAFFLLATIVLVGVVSYFIMVPFLKPLFLAFVIYQLFKHWYKKLSKKIKYPSIASILMCFILFFILALPFIVITGLATKEATTLYQKIQTTDWQPYITSITSYPALEKIGMTSESLNFKNLDILSNSEKITQEAPGIGNFVFSIIKSIYQETTHILFMIFVLFFTLYYLFKDGERIIDKLMNLSPLKNKAERRLLNDFVSISKATLKGSLVIALIQGALITLTFWITGVTSPVLWGLITVLVSLIPLIGVVLIWLPVGLAMFFMGFVWQAIVIFIIGAVVISSIDNVLRPKLVGDESSLHPILVFFSTMGGLVLFGISGFLLGPVIIVLFLSLLNIYKDEYKEQIQESNF